MCPSFLFFDLHVPLLSFRMCYSSIYAFIYEQWSTTAPMCSLTWLLLTWSTFSGYDNIVVNLFITCILLIISHIHTIFIAIQSNLLRKCSEWQRSFTARSGNVSTEASLCDMIGFAFLYMKTEESDHEECNT